MSKYKIAVYPESTAYISFSGKVDVNLIDKALKTCEFKNILFIVIDFGEVENICVGSINRLKEEKEKLTLKYGRICLVKPTPKIKILFDMLRVSEEFYLFENKEIGIKEIHNTITRKLNKKDLFNWD